MDEQREPFYPRWGAYSTPGYKPTGYKRMGRMYRRKHYREMREREEPGLRLQRENFRTQKRRSRAIRVRLIKELEDASNE